MKMRFVAPMRIAKIGYIIISALFCMAGIFLCLEPETSTAVIGASIGAAMLLFGAVKLVGYFSKDLFRLAFQFDLEFGILMLILGVVVLLQPDDIMTVLCIALGITVLLDGLFKIRIAMDSKRFGITSWQLILVMAILTGFIGMALILGCVIGERNPTVLPVGVALLSEGMLNLCTVLSTVLIIRHQQPDRIEEESYEISGKGK